MVQSPYLIGIAGPSCSGKSEISQHLIRRFSTKTSTVIPLDAYYKDLSSLRPGERDKRNFDLPEALDYDLLKEHLQLLIRGNEVKKPIYDFTTHTRSTRFEKITPCDLIVIEGLFTFYWKDMRDLFHTRVFVALDDQLCLDRRIARDTNERGRSKASVIAQYKETVKPMNEMYVLPTKPFADIVVSGNDPVEKSTLHIMDHLNVKRT